MSEAKAKPEAPRHDLLRNSEAEDALVGWLLADPELMWRVGITRALFSGSWQREAVDVVRELSAAGDKVSVFAVAQGLKRRGVGAADELERLVTLQDEKRYYATAAELVKLLRDCMRRREMERLGRMAVNLARAGDEDVTDSAAKVSEALALLGAETDIELADLREEVDAAAHRLLNKKPGEIDGLPTGFPSLDRQIGGLPYGELTYVAGRPGMGKALPLSAQVKTTTGWANMGDLVVGQRLASPDGRPSEVTGIFPQGTCAVYRVTFSDGRKVMATADHLWTVRLRREKHTRVITTADIAKVVARPDKGVFVPLVSGKFGRSVRLPVDPYVLGVLLGDGALSGSDTPRFSSADPDLVARVAARLPKRVRVRKTYGPYAYSITLVHGVRLGHRRPPSNPVRVGLSRLGLWGTNSYTKFIPAVYLEASRRARVELLRGLLDTDGTVEKARSGTGCVRYSTSSKRLADDVRRLAWSLGAVCGLKSRMVSHKGSRPRLNYLLTIRHPRRAQFFTLARKKTKLAGRYQYSSLGLRVVSVRAAGEAVCQCIMVSHPAGQFITNGYVVTHNSAFAQQVCEWNAANGEVVLICSPEMRKRQLAHRTIARRAGVPLYSLRFANLKDAQRDEISRVGSMTPPLVVFDKGRMTTDDVGAAARKVRARFKKIGLVAVDHIQFLSSTQKYVRDPVQEIGERSKTLKQLACELGCPFMVLSQLRRPQPGGKKEGVHKPTLSDMRGSGDLEQDADVVLGLHRPGYYSGKDEEAELGEVLILKARNGPTGEVMLRWDGVVSAFRDYQEA